MKTKRDKWTDVRDGFPYHNQEVLGYTGGGKIITTFWNEDYKTWDVYNSGTASWEEFTITHWMPLPDPPK